jgi:hypothetical protein
MMHRPAPGNIEELGEWLARTVRECLERERDRAIETFDRAVRAEPANPTGEDRAATRARFVEALTGQGPTTKAELRADLAAIRAAERPTPGAELRAYVAGGLAAAEMLAAEGRARRAAGSRTSQEIAADDADWPADRRRGTP